MCSQEAKVVGGGKWCRQGGSQIHDVSIVLLLTRSAKYVLLQLEADRSRCRTTAAADALFTIDRFSLLLLLLLLLLFLLVSSSLILSSLMTFEKFKAYGNILTALYRKKNQLFFLRIILS